MPDYDFLDNAQLYAAIDTQFARVIADEDLQPQLDTQLVALYDVLDDPDFRDYLGVVDARINAHLALIYGMAQRGAVLDALLQEYETRFRAAPYRSFKRAGEMGQSDF